MQAVNGPGVPCTWRLVRRRVASAGNAERQGAKVMVRVRYGFVGVAVLMTMAQAPVPSDRLFHIVQQSGAVIDCGGRAISLDGQHTSVRLTGHCPVVQIAGEHNDVTVPVPPGGIVQIVAPHNDVTWRQTRPGRPPQLLASAPSNTFHPSR